MACHASRPARIELPFDWIAKSTIVVVPPCAAATVPVSKSSDAVVPPNGSSMCVWQSMPPGITYWPFASIVSSAVPGTVPGAASAAILPLSIQTSAANVSLAVTTVPFLISVRILRPYRFVFGRAFVCGGSDGRNSAKSSAGLKSSARNVTCASATSAIACPSFASMTSSASTSYRSRPRCSNTFTFTQLVIIPRRVSFDTLAPSHARARAGRLHV